MRRVWQLSVCSEWIERYEAGNDIVPEPLVHPRVSRINTLCCPMAMCICFLRLEIQECLLHKHIIGYFSRSSNTCTADLSGGYRDMWYSA